MKCERKSWSVPNSAGEVRAGQTTSLLTGLNIDEALARYASTGRSTQLTDQLGSVIRQINEAGTPQSTTAYSPYGEATTSGDDQQNSTEYTARENDETGLYFYRARYYDPVLKRFISEDPIGVAGGLNLYSYVGGNPVSYVDPTGHTQFALIGGALTLWGVYEIGKAVNNYVNSLEAAGAARDANDQLINNLFNNNGVPPNADAINQQYYDAVQQAARNGGNLGVEVGQKIYKVPGSMCKIQNK